MRREGNPFTLEGKNIMVTGGSSGLGRACAIEASKQGARVFVLGRDGERLQETLSLMANPDLHSLHCVEFTDVSAINELFSEFRRDRQKFNGLVHCAGISTTLPLKMVSEEKLNNFFATNVNSSIFLSQQLSKKCFLEESGSSLVLMASIMGVVGEMGKSLYSATKGALVSAAKSMAVELAARKVRVNTVSPGVVKSPMTNTAFYSRDEEAYKKIAAKHPLGIGAPEDIANTCVFLLSDASRWITGTNVIVDGGYTAK
ncbi:SDR family oxidoreductase [Puteibacter caeruleilacunae]|nr:SDR family oxidoreductase [Puteibacter caeruleilacunae]